MNETDAAKLAADYAREQGYDPAQYDVRAASKEGEWEIYFERKSARVRPGPGDFFTVYVDDRSQSVERIVHGK